MKKRITAEDIESLPEETKKALQMINYPWTIEGVPVMNIGDMIEYLQPTNEQDFSEPEARRITITNSKVSVEFDGSSISICRTYPKGLNGDDICEALWSAVQNKALRASPEFKEFIEKKEKEFTDKAHEEVLD